MRELVMLEAEMTSIKEINQVLPDFCPDSSQQHCLEC